MILQVHQITFRPHEEGTVKCEATNEAGTNVAKALVLFADNNNSDRFFIEPSTHRPIIVDEALSITCVAINPNFIISLEWYLNDTLVDWIPSGTKCGKF